MIGSTGRVGTVMVRQIFLLIWHYGEWWGRDFKRGNCHVRGAIMHFGGCERAIDLMAYICIYNLHASLFPPPGKQKIRINRDFTTSHFIGDGRLSIELIAKEKNAPRTCRWWNGKCVVRFLSPFGFHRAGKSLLPVFSAAFSTWRIRRRIGWVLIYHCLIISPRFSLSSRFKSFSPCLSIPCDCYLMFFSGFSLFPCILPVAGFCLTQPFRCSFQDFCHLLPCFCATVDCLFATPVYLGLKS